MAAKAHQQLNNKSSDSIGKELPPADSIGLEPEFEQLLSDLDGAAPLDCLKVFKVGPRGGNDLSHVFSRAIDGARFDEILTELRTTYGPGEYRVIVRRDGRNVANRTVSIAPTLQELRPNTTPISAPAVVPTDPLETALKWAPIITPLLTSLLGRPPPQGLTVADVMMFHKMATGEKKDPVEEVQKMMQMMKLLKEDDSPNVGSGDLLTRGMGLVESLINASNPTAAIAASGAPAPHAAVTAAPTPAAIAVLLTRAAARDCDPAPYASVLLDSLPEQYLPQIKTLAASPAAWMQQIAALVSPALRQYPAWCEDLRKAVIELLTEDDDGGLLTKPESDSEPAPHADASGLPAGAPAP